MSTHSTQEQPDTFSASGVASRPFTGHEATPITTQASALVVVWVLEDEGGHGCAVVLFELLVACLDGACWVGKHQSDHAQWEPERLGQPHASRSLTTYSDRGLRTS